MMEYQITHRGVELYAPEEFDLYHTFECGQCFRWQEADDHTYSGIAFGQRIRLYRDGDMVVMEGADEESFSGRWRNYFDIDTDYEQLRQEMVAACPVLRQAARKLNGIRILQQEPWEALCSFIISQNNHIPRIRGIIERLCACFGEEADGGYSFPSAERLAMCEAEDLAPLRAGFRARYLVDAARKCASGQVDLEKLKTAPLDECRRELMSVVGVGIKVAECTMLYGLHRMEAFPVDVWMKRALAEDFAGVSPEALGHTAGIAQQYMFHYTRSRHMKS